MPACPPKGQDCLLLSFDFNKPDLGSDLIIKSS